MHGSHDVTALLRDFLPILSHDVRTPMTAIKGAAGVLGAGFGGTLTEHQARLVDICDRNADLATLLVQDVVDILRLSVGISELHPTDLDVFDEAAEVWSELAPHTTLHLALRPPNRPTPLRTDRHYLRRALSALIRFPQPYEAVERVSLSVTHTSEGAHMALVCHPLSAEQANVEGLQAAPARSIRQCEGRLNATGMEMFLLSMLARRFSTSLVVDGVLPRGSSTEAVRVRLAWPTMER